MFSSACAAGASCWWRARDVFEERADHTKQKCGKLRLPAFTCAYGACPMCGDKTVIKTFLVPLFGAPRGITMHSVTGLDFSDVTSLEKAEALYVQGKLEKVLLFPAEFGGAEIPQNTVFVPHGVSDAKDQITGTLIRFFNEGLINKLVVEPEYKGKSAVPSKLNMRAWHTEKEGGFNPSITIW
jgi:hypothetical protein